MATRRVHAGLILNNVLAHNIMNTDPDEILLLIY